MKIEDRIEKLQNELNEIKNELKKEIAKPALKVGDWFIPHKPKNTGEYPTWNNYMDKYDSIPLKIRSISSDGSYVSEITGGYWFNPAWCEKWEPKRGDYCYIETFYDWVIIFDKYQNGAIYDYAAYAAYALSESGQLCNISDIKIIAPASPEQIKLIDDKLTENGLRFNKETLELEKISKYKEPVNGKCYPL